MSRPYNPLAIHILEFMAQSPALSFHELYKAHGKAKSRKAVYDAVYRLSAQGMLALTRDGYAITPEGLKLIHKFTPQKDGIWKIVIFDIPESKRQVRTFLTSRLKALNFKRWQNSIWISPYALEPEIETELKKLAERYFIRLIKTKQINYTEDLKKLFA